jgi:hypothetical protein
MAAKAANPEVFIANLEKLLEQAGQTPAAA